MKVLSLPESTTRHEMSRCSPSVSTTCSSSSSTVVEMTLARLPGTSKTRVARPSRPTWREKLGVMRPSLRHSSVAAAGRFRLAIDAVDRVLVLGVDDAALHLLRRRQLAALDGELRRHQVPGLDALVAGQLGVDRLDLAGDELLDLGRLHQLLVGREGDALRPWARAQGRYVSPLLTTRGLLS